MKKLNVKQIIGRSLFIWTISFLLSSICCAIFFSLTKESTIKDSFPYTFTEILGVFVIGSTIFLFPSLLIIFFGLHYIYVKTNLIKFQYWRLIFLGIFNSAIVMIIVDYLQDELFFIHGIGYSFISTLMIIAIPYIKRDFK